MPHVNLLHGVNGGRPRNVGSTHVGDQCPTCGTKEKFFVACRKYGRVYRYERCAWCIRQKARAKYRQSREARVRSAVDRKRALPAERSMFIQARNRARIKGLAFDLEIEDIAIPSVCPLLGIPIQRGNGGPIPNSPTLDRIDSSKGYVKGNVWVVSWRANSLKKDATVDELRAMLRALEARLAS